MKWLEDIINTLVEDEAKRKEVTESIKKELGLQFVPKATFNEVNNELKASKEQLATTETTIKELTSKAATAEEKDALIKKMQEDHKAFQADTDKRMTNTQKLADIQVRLATEVSPDAVDLIAGLIDLEKAELKDGKVTNYDDIIKPHREARKSLFKSETVQGDPPADKRSPEGDAVKSDAEYYASLKMPSLI